MTATDNRPGQVDVDTQVRRVGPVTTGNHSSGSHRPIDPHVQHAAGTSLPADQPSIDAQCRRVGGEQIEDGSAATRGSPAPKMAPSLADPFLALAADILDDTEGTKNANENRLRQLTRATTDSDGHERGFGLDESHPDVANLAALVELLGKVEHEAVLQLQRKMRKHPLGPWIKAQKGVGDKQAARLLAVIGDPYWNTLHDRPRIVSELWAYCGLHTLPASQLERDTHGVPAGGDSSPVGGDQLMTDTQSARVAARRRKGVKSNWSGTAKSRAYLIAESMLRAGNRETYDKRKAATEGRVHPVPCPQCGPKGKPAQPGSPWSDGHRHADALRITSKELLKNLWREAKRLHENGEASR